MFFKRLMSLVVVLVLAVEIHQFQRQADHIRLYEHSIEERYFLPQPAVMHTMSMGYHHLVAELMWVRSILLYSDFVMSCQPEQSQWLLSMLRAVKHLDPEWRTLYFWGGTMLSLCQDIDGSDELFMAGAEQFPEDAFFPFSVAMNALLEREDSTRALEWMTLAANKPSAPPWYKAAVGGLLKEGKGQEASIRYLEAQLADENLRPNVRSLTEYRLRLLQHELYQSELEAKRSAWESEQNMIMFDLTVLEAVPEDPFGVGWILSPDGHIRSAYLEEQEARRSFELELSWLQRQDWVP